MGSHKVPKGSWICSEPINTVLCFLRQASGRLASPRLGTGLRGTGQAEVQVAVQATRSQAEDDRESGKIIGPANTRAKLEREGTRNHL